MNTALFRRQLFANHRTGGGQRLQLAFCIVCQASIELCLSIRLRVIGTGGRVGTELEVRTQNNTFCNRSNEF